MEPCRRRDGQFAGSQVEALDICGTAVGGEEVRRNGGIGDRVSPRTKDARLKCLMRSDGVLAKR